MIPGLQRRSGWLMASGVINFIAGVHTRDVPIVIVEQPRPDDAILGYVICDHTACCRHHGTHVTPHTRCILR